MRRLFTFTALCGLIICSGCSDNDDWTPSQQIRRVERLVSQFPATERDFLQFIDDIEQGLWDLDGTLGRTWNRFTENPEQGWVSGGFRIYERIINENPANIHQKIYDRWNEIKDGPLSPSNFAQ